ncbi:MAG TPA: peptidylprolyl isomerase [Anaerolineaceae bacterium]
MSTRKRIKRSTQPEAAASSQRTIQVIALVVIVLGLLAVAWAIFAANKPQQAASPAAPTVSAKQYSSPPPMTIDKNKQYTATVKMVKGGEFVIQLYPQNAPITVNSFVFLARQGFFNGVTFHRVLDGFMAQGGDPTGTGTGGPGYQFVNEDSNLTFDTPGVVAMANAGRDTNGSQFFITFGPTPQLNGGYTIFGQIISGMDVVNGLTRRDPQQNPTFPGDAIESITITEK